MKIKQELLKRFMLKDQNSFKCKCFEGENNSEAART